MEISKDEIEKLLTRQADLVAKESDERIQLYIGGLKEDFDHKLDAVVEYVQDIPKIKEDVNVLQKDIAEMKPKLDATFEKVSEIAVDTEVIMESLKNHERRLQQLETR